MALKTRYSPLQHFSFDNLFMAFAELSPQRKFIVLGVITLILVLILFLPISLFSGKVSSLKRDIANAQKNYAQVEDKITEYRKVKAEIDGLEAQFGKPSGALTTRIDNTAKQSGMNVDQVKEKAPQETDYMEISSLEVKFSNVALAQLMEFLFNLENDKTSPMRVRRIEIKPKTNNRQILDVPSLEVATFSVKKEI